MSPKIEKTLGIVSAIGVIAGVVALYGIGVDNFSDPVMADYLIKIVLYPSMLVLIRFVWKSSLDNKIKSKAQQKADLEKMIKENEEEK